MSLFNRMNDQVVCNKRKLSDLREVIKYSTKHQRLFPYLIFMFLAIVRVQSQTGMRPAVPYCVFSQRSEDRLIIYQVSEVLSVNQPTSTQQFKNISPHSESVFCVCSYVYIYIIHTHTHKNICIQYVWIYVYQGKGVGDIYSGCVFTLAQNHQKVQINISVQRLEYQEGSSCPSSAAVCETEGKILNLQVSIIICYL